MHETVFALFFNRFSSLSKYSKPFSRIKAIVLPIGFSHKFAYLQMRQ